MTENKFEVNWPVVVLVVFVVGIGVVLFFPEVWDRMEQTALKVIGALKGIVGR